MREAVHEDESAGEHIADQFHDERRAGDAYPGREAQLERGSAVYAYFECGDDHAESGDQYDSGADRVGNLPVAGRITAWDRPGSVLPQQTEELLQRRQMCLSLSPRALLARELPGQHGQMIRQR